MLQLGLILLVFSFTIVGIIMFLATMMDVQNKKKMNSIRILLDQYFNQNNKYPDQLLVVSNVKSIGNLPLQYKIENSGSNYRLWIEFKGKVIKITEADKDSIRIVTKQ